METEITDTTDTTTDKTEPFVIDSEDRANWLLRKLAAIDGEKERIAAQTDQRLRELDADRESLLFRFGAQLQAWAKEESIRRHRQTVTLQQGTVVFRHQPAKLIIGDQTDALTTARIACPDAIKTETVEKFDKTAFLKFAAAHFEATGEMLPGTDRSIENESFSIRFSAGKKGKVKAEPEAEEEE